MIMIMIVMGMMRKTMSLRMIRMVVTLMRIMKIVRMLKEALPKTGKYRNFPITGNPSHGPMGMV